MLITELSRPSVKAVALSLVCSGIETTNAVIVTDVSGSMRAALEGATLHTGNDNIILAARSLGNLQEGVENRTVRKQRLVRSNT